MLRGAERKKRSVRTVAVASGKGGVGKTNVVANLGIAIQKMGKKVMILDADLGLSNIDILLHLAPRYNIQHVLQGTRTIGEVLVEGPQGVKILPASSGVQELTALDEFQRLKILEEFDSYDDDLDLLLIDTSAGISENVAFFCIASQQNIIVTSPEPTSITDAYALIKVLCTRYQERSFNILVNAARSYEEAMEVFRRISVAAQKFLNISLNYLGYIPYDETVRKAVGFQKAFVELYPKSDASIKIFEIAEKIMDSERKVKGTLQFFIGNLIASHA